MSRPAKPLWKWLNYTSTQFHSYTSKQETKMSKPNPNKLAAALKQQAKGNTLPAAPAEPAASPAHRGHTRQDRIMVSGWLPMEARSSFRLIQAKHPEKKMQDLVVEAMNDLFAKYNVPQTAGG
jgi:hypothetical protein